MHCAKGRDATHMILKEHQQLRAVIAGMQHFVSLLEAGMNAPPKSVFRAMLHYIREYPEKIHHPKEDLYLFSRLRVRTDTVNDAVDELEAQHLQGESKLCELESAFERYEREGESALPALRSRVDDYALSYQRHCQIEETVILPAARRYLTPEDWAQLDEAFSVNRDPFHGAKLADDLDRLFVSMMSIISDTVR